MSRADRSGYQPLRSIEDETEEEAGQLDGSDGLRPTARPRLGPGSVDLTKLDNAFKRFVLEKCLYYIWLICDRWTESIAQKVKRKKKTAETQARKHIWRSIFEPAVTGLPNSGFVCYSSTLRETVLMSIVAREDSRSQTSDDAGRLRFVGFPFPSPSRLFLTLHFLVLLHQ